jgi:hypothetical protein
MVTYLKYVGAPTFSFRNESTVVRGDFVAAGLQPRQPGMTKVMHLQGLGHDVSCPYRRKERPAFLFCKRRSFQ